MISTGIIWHKLSFLMKRFLAAKDKAAAFFAYFFSL
jgi:hypothetical protein